MQTPVSTDPTTAATIKSMLRARLGRQWRVGDRLPPVKELARQLGMGQSNTQLAVRALAKDGLLVSRRRQGTFVASIPPSRGTELFVDMLAGRTVHMYHSGPRTTEFIYRMMNAFKAAMAPSGAILQPVQTTELGLPEIDPTADAAVLFGASTSMPIRCEPHQLLTVVGTTRYAPVLNHKRYDVVGVDEIHGGMLAGQMLRESGCRRACFVGRRLGTDDSRYDAISVMRLHGFEAGWGSVLPSDCLIKATAYNGFGGAGAFRTIQAMREKPDGIFTASDDIAYGILMAAESHGLTPGRDFQIVGFDGQDRGPHPGELVLSTIRVPCDQLGQRAARLLTERFNEPDRPVDRLSLDCIAKHGTTTLGANLDRQS